MAVVESRGWKPCLRASRWRTASTTASLADRLPPAASSATSSSSPLENGASSARASSRAHRRRRGSRWSPASRGSSGCRPANPARSIVANRIMPSIMHQAHRCRQRRPDARVDHRGHPRGRRASTRRSEASCSTFTRLTTVDVNASASSHGSGRAARSRARGAATRGRRSRPAPRRSRRSSPRGRDTAIWSGDAELAVVKRLQPTRSAAAQVSTVMGSSSSRSSNAQRLSGARQPRFHRADGQAERERDLLVAQAVNLAKHDRRPLVERQAVRGPAAAAAPSSFCASTRSGRQTERSTGSSPWADWCSSSDT